MLSGELTGLRGIERSDLEQLRLWRNQPELRRHFRGHREIGPDAQIAWYENVVVPEADAKMFAVVELASGELLGCAGLVFLDLVNRTADMSIYLGARDLYIDDQFAPDAARVLLRYAFETVDLAHVWNEIYEFDEAKKSLLEGLGFQLEGVHREHHYDDGRRYDSHFYGLLRREFKTF